MQTHRIRYCADRQGSRPRTARSQMQSIILFAHDYRQDFLLMGQVLSELGPVMRFATCEEAALPPWRKV